MKTGGHIKPCKVGSVEEHNERKEEYVERMKQSKHPLYFYPDLALRPNFNRYNESREQYLDKDTRKRLTVAQVFNKMIEVYTDKDKRHRRPPLKERERFDPKTGKMKTIAGWSPIREMVVVIKPDTKPEHFNKVNTWFRENRVEPMFLSLHFDEGHLDDAGNLKANNHAHMGLDFFDWETGKTVKLGPKKMKELQTILADALGMERGEIKEITGKEHLDVVEQRIDAQEKRMLPKLMRHIKGTDKEALEVAQQIIENDKKKAQRFLSGAEVKLDKAEKKLALAGEKLAEVEQREADIDNIVDAARTDEHDKMQLVVDEWVRKYNTQCTLNHNKSDQMKQQRDTITQQNRDIDGLKKTVSQLKQQIEKKDSLFNDLLEALMSIPYIGAAIKAIIRVATNYTPNAFTQEEVNNVATSVNIMGADALWSLANKHPDLANDKHDTWHELCKDLVDRIEQGVQQSMKQTR